MAGSPQKRARTNRWLTLVGDPATLRDICDFVAEGHSLVEWVREQDVRYGDVWSWIIADDQRKSLYAQALEGRNEFLNELVVRNLRQMADADPAQAYHDGKLLPFIEWPEGLRRAVLSIEYGSALTTAVKKNKTREVSKVKLVDPARAAELLGKYRKLFVEQHEHKGKLTLEDLVGGSMRHDG